MQADYYGFDFCDYYLQHGQMLPDGWQQVYSPGMTPSSSAQWDGLPPCPITCRCGSLLKFRQEFDQYIGLRPVRLMPGVVSPLPGGR